MSSEEENQYRIAMAWYSSHDRNNQVDLDTKTSQNAYLCNYEKTDVKLYLARESVCQMPSTPPMVEKQQLGHSKLVAQAWQQEKHQSQFPH